MKINLLKYIALFCVSLSFVLFGTTMLAKEQSSIAVLSPDVLAKTVVGYTMCNADCPWFDPDCPEQSCTDYTYGKCYARDDWDFQEQAYCRVQKPGETCTLYDWDNCYANQICDKASGVACNHWAMPLCSFFHINCYSNIYKSYDNCRDS